MNSYFILSTILSFLGLAAAAAVLLLNLFRLHRHGFRWDVGGYLAISLFYGWRLILSLRQQFTGIACALTPERTLLVYGGLLLLHIGFAWDSWRSLVCEKGEKKDDQ